MQFLRWVMPVMVALAMVVVATAAAEPLVAAVPQ